MRRPASRSKRRAATSVWGLKVATPSARPSPVLSVTRPPGVSALAAASIWISLEKIQGWPCSARFWCPGSSVTVGRSAGLSIMVPQSSRGPSAGKRSISECYALTSRIGAALEAARRAHNPVEATLEVLARDDMPARLQLHRDRIAGRTELDIGVAVAIAD